jgi:hypothetical protein
VLVLVALVVAAMILTAGAYMARVNPDVVSLFAPEHSCGGG